MRAIEFIHKQTVDAMIKDGYNETQAKFIADYVLEEYKTGRMKQATHILNVAKAFAKQQYQFKD